jgi:alpha-galactosidase
MKEKFVLIGAGSAYFTRKLVFDLIQRNKPVVLGLVDTDETACRMAERLAGKMIALKDAPIEVEASTNRRDLLPGATAVISMIAVGGRQAWEQDVAIPRKYGIYHPGGDTTMPAGTSRSLRVVPPAVAIAEDVLDLAPQAVYFNYSNPMAVVSRAIRKQTGADVIGLCTGVKEVAEYLAEVAGADRFRFAYNAVGINHMTWFTETRVDGKDVTPRLRQVAQRNIARAEELAALVDDSPEKDDLRREIRALQPFCWRLFLLLGAFPSAFDGHVVEFFPHLFRGRNSYFGMTLGLESEQHRAREDETYARMQEEAFSDHSLPDDYCEQIPGAREDAIDIFYGMRADDGAVYSANLPNRGRIPELPDECIIEAPAAATGAGMRPLAQPPLSPGLLGTLATPFQCVEATVDAALEGNRDKVVQAMILDGAVASVDDAEKLTDDLLAAQAQHLPQFAERVAGRQVGVMDMRG